MEEDKSTKDTKVQNSEQNSEPVSDGPKIQFSSSALGAKEESISKRDIYDPDGENSNNDEYIVKNSSISRNSMALDPNKAGKKKKPVNNVPPTPGTLSLAQWSGSVMQATKSLMPQHEEEEKKTTFQKENPAAQNANIDKEIGHFSITAEMAEMSLRDNTAANRTAMIKPIAIAAAIIVVLVIALKLAKEFLPPEPPITTSTFVKISLRNKMREDSVRMVDNGQCYSYRKDEILALFCEMKNEKFAAGLSNSSTEEIVALKGFNETIVEEDLSGPTHFACGIDNCFYSAYSKKTFLFVSAPKEMNDEMMNTVRSYGYLKIK